MANSIMLKVYFSIEGARKLQDYLEMRYGNRRMRSFTVERAVMWWIQIEEAHLMDEIEEFIKARRN